ncbi:hypothetical protein [Streptosporangium canum]|uniref:hypothetical protein n=1 Tax=Streptosporangium canum TaxID=324952 RepID=UPI003797B03F
METGGFAGEEDRRLPSETHDDLERTRGFPGSGWREEPEPDEPRRRGKMLLAVVAAVVVAGLTGGWVLSAGMGSTPDASCPAGAGCARAELPKPETPTAEPTGPEETAQPPAEESAAPEPEISRAPVPRTRAPRPTPTRSIPPVKPSPEPTRERGEVGSRNLDPRPQVSSESEPGPPSEAPAPSESAPAEDPAPSGNPPPAESPSRGGGLLDWLF